MNAEKANGPITIISLTQIEFGSMSIVLSNIEIARVKKGYDLGIRQMKAFLRSMSKIGIIKDLPADFNILSISRILAAQSFPSDIYYEIFVSEILKDE